MKINNVSDLTPLRKAVDPVYAWAKGKWGADKVDEVLAAVEKIRKEYPDGGKTYFGVEASKPPSRNGQFDRVGSFCSGPIAHCVTRVPDLSGRAGRRNGNG